jgi:hypothetical protein
VVPAVTRIGVPFVPVPERHPPPASIVPGPGLGHDVNTVRFVLADIFSISMEVVPTGGVNSYQTTDSVE